MLLRNATELSKTKILYETLKRHWKRNSPKAKKEQNNGFRVPKNCVSWTITIIEVLKGLQPTWKFTVFVSTVENNA